MNGVILNWRSSLIPPASVFLNSSRSHVKDSATAEKADLKLSIRGQRQRTLTVL